MNGKFISLEGIEGAGKSTQLNFIEQYLTARGITVVVTREPGGTALGEELRQVLLTPRDTGMSEDTELLLMFAARVEHLQQKILPALKRGDWVLSDRFVDSTFAYQGGGRKIDLQRIQSLADWSLNGFKTDLTLLFDVPVSVSRQRVAHRGQAEDRFEQEKAQFFEAVRNCYLARAQAEPERIKTLDASQLIQQTQAQITPLLDQLLNQS